MLCLRQQDDCNTRGGMRRESLNYLTQAVLYVLELCIAISGLFILGNVIAQKDIYAWTYNIISFDFLGKAMVLYGVYQIAIFAFWSLFDSARKDSILLKIKVVKLGILRNEYNQPFNDLEILYNRYTKSNLLINKYDKSDIDEIYTHYQQYVEGSIDKNSYDFYLKNKLILLEDRYEYYDLAWRLSLFLRIGK